MYSFVASSVTKMVESKRGSITLILIRYSRWSDIWLYSHHVPEVSLTSHCHYVPLSLYVVRHLLAGSQSNRTGQCCVSTQLLVDIRVIWRDELPTNLLNSCLDFIFTSCTLRPVVGVSVSCQMSQGIFRVAYIKQTTLIKCQRHTDRSLLDKHDFCWSWEL